MTEYKKFTLTQRYGIDDLTSIYPYTEDGWNPQYTGGKFGWTEQQYKADPEGYQKVVSEHNAKYVAELKAKGEYGKEWQTHFNFATLPEFDDNKPIMNYSNIQILIPKGENNPSPHPPIKYFKDDEI